DAALALIAGTRSQGQQNQATSSLHPARTLRLLERSLLSVSRSLPGLQRLLSHHFSLPKSEQVHTPALAASSGCSAVRCLCQSPWLKLSSCTVRTGPFPHLITDSD